MADNTDQQIEQITLPDVYVKPGDNEVSPSDSMTAGQNPQQGQPGFADNFGYALGGALDLNSLPPQIAPLDDQSGQRTASFAGLPSPDMAQFSLDDKIPLAQPVTLPQNLRQEYSHALQTGETTSAQDFAERVAGLSWAVSGDATPADPDFQNHDTTAGAVTNATQAIAAGLPDHEDLIDHSLALSQQVMGQPDLDMARVIRSNLLDAWAATGTDPSNMIRNAYAEPDLAQQLATPRSVPVNYPTPAELAVKGRDAIQDPLGNMTTDPVMPKVLRDVLPADILTAQEEYDKQDEELKAKGVSLSDRISQLGVGPMANSVGVANMEEAGGIAFGSLMRSFFRQMPLTEAKAVTQQRETAAGIISGNEGQRRYRMAMAQQALEGYYKEVNKLVPGYKAWTEQYQANLRASATMKDQWVAEGGDPDKFSMVNPTEGIDYHPLQALYDHMQQREGGARLDDKSPLKPLADTIRQLMDERQEWLNADDMRQRAMVEDYYPQSWVNPRGKVEEALANFFGTGREGSAAHLIERRVPTIFDGLTRGLIPKFFNPIEGALHYIGQVDSLMAAEQNMKAMLDNGATWADRAPPGMVKLDGRMAERTLRWVEMPRGSNSGEPIARSKDQNVYAPQGMARIYNNWLSKGIHQWKLGGAIYDNVIRLKNASLGMSLGLSGFHPFVITVQSVGSQLGLAAESWHNPGVAAKQLARAPIAPYQVVSRGSRFDSVYLGKADNATPLEQQLKDAYIKAGGRAPTEGRGEPYWASQGHNLWTSYTRAGGGLEGFIDMLRSVAAPYLDEGGAIGSPTERTAYRVLALPFRTTMAMADTIGRVADTVMAPVFDKLVPLASRGAWANAMEQFIQANPTASEEAIAAEGRRVLARVQNGMGEMDMNSLYWNRTITQIMQAATVSMGWEFGTWRGVGKAFEDAAFAPTGRRMGTNIANVAGYIAAAATFGAVYQYLKTGTIASNPFLPQTTSNPTSGVLLPGEQKEFTRLLQLIKQANGNPLAYAQVVPKYLWGKVQTIPKDFYALLTSKNMGSLMKELIYQHQPIVTSQRGGNPNVSLSPFEQWIGIHPAPRELTGAPKASSSTSRGIRPTTIGRNRSE
jgi:hypothetical protein